MIVPLIHSHLRESLSQIFARMRAIIANECIASDSVNEGGADWALVRSIGVYKVKAVNPPPSLNNWRRSAPEGF
jgi:hypothetical protein